MISLFICWGEAKRVGKRTDKQHCPLSIPATAYLVHVPFITFQLTIYTMETDG